MKSISLAARRLSLLFTTALAVEELLALDTTYREIVRKRLAEVRLSDQQQLRLSLYPDVLHLLVLISVDDPDTVAVLPVLAQMAAASPRLDLRILTDEDDLSYLSNIVEEPDLSRDLDELDLPLLFVLDEEWTVQATWGPRPEKADERLDVWLAAHPEYETLAESESDDEQAAYAQLLDELTYAMRVWYNSGVDSACIDEILELLDDLNGDEAEDENGVADKKSASAAGSSRT